MRCGVVVVVVVEDRVVIGSGLLTCGVHDGDSCREARGGC